MPHKSEPTSPYDPSPSDPYITYTKLLFGLLPLCMVNGEHYFKISKK